MSLKRSERKIRGIKGGKERGYYSHYHTNNLNIFVTIFTTCSVCTKSVPNPLIDLCRAIALIYINTYAIH